jgi:hypothetical protein
MGEGFVVLQSNDVDLYYYMDEPGMSSLKVVQEWLCFFPEGLLPTHWKSSES